MGDGVNMYASAANQRTDAMTTRANGRLQRQQAYANAYKLEDDAARGSHVAADNMMTMRRNQSAAVAASRVAHAASGFGASGGSKLAAEASVAEVFEKAIADAAKSNAIADVNAREQANAFRRQGDTALNLANINADYLNRLAAINSKAAPWMMLGSALSLGGSLTNQFKMASSGEGSKKTSGPGSAASGPGSAAGGPGSAGGGSSSAGGGSKGS